MKIRLVLLLVLLAGLCSCVEDRVEPIKDWTRLNDFPGIARSSAASFVVGDKAYVCLGRSDLKSGFLNDLWEYDSQADNWSRKTDFPGAGRVKAIAGVIGTKAYVGMGSIGPYDLSNQFDDFWEYDTKTDTWTRKASFPGEGRNDLFCTVIDGILYVTMGYTGTVRSIESWQYDPKTNGWTSFPEGPERISNKAGFSIGKNMYVGSGFDGHNLKRFYRYQTENKKWSRIADLPQGRVLSNGLSINGQGFILLGRFWNGTLNGGRLLSDIVQYDPASDSWTRRGDFPGGGRQNATVFSIGDKGYVLMGEDDMERKRDVWMFRP